MDFFESMDNNQKIILGIAVVTLIVAIYIYFSGKKAEGMKTNRPPKPPAEPVSQPPSEKEVTPVSESPAELVVFTMPGCGHCKAFEPTWNEFAQNFDGYHGVKLIHVSIRDAPELAELHGFSGFPSIKFCPKGVRSTEGVVYNGDRSIQSLAQFLQQNA